MIKSNRNITFALSDGVFTSIDLTKANVPDVNYLKELNDSLSDCTLLADKGYINTGQQLDFIPFR